MGGELGAPPGDGHLLPALFPPPAPRVGRSQCPWGRIPESLGASPAAAGSAVGRRALGVGCRCNQGLALVSVKAGL